MLVLGDYDTLLNIYRGEAEEHQKNMNKKWKSFPTPAPFAFAYVTGPAAMLRLENDYGRYYNEFVNQCGLRIRLALLEMEFGDNESAQRDFREVLEMSQKANIDYPERKLALEYTRLYERARKK